MLTLLWLLRLTPAPIRQTLHACHDSAPCVLSPEVMEGALPLVARVERPVRSPVLASTYPLLPACRALLHSRHRHAVQHHRGPPGRPVQALGRGHRCRDVPAARLLCRPLDGRCRRSLLRLLGLDDHAPAWRRRTARQGQARSARPWRTGRAARAWWPSSTETDDAWSRVSRSSSSAYFDQSS
jgi:hypothetical protein